MLVTLLSVLLSHILPYCVSCEIRTMCGRKSVLVILNRSYIAISYELKNKAIFYMTRSFIFAGPVTNYLKNQKLRM